MHNLLAFSLKICFTAVGGVFIVLFVSCFFAEKSRTLIIDMDTISFPRGAIINDKTVLKRTVINTNEISSVESRLYKGDQIITLDCYFYTLILNNGTKITITLYHYGEKSEEEIIGFIKERIQKT